MRDRNAAARNLRLDAAYCAICAALLALLAAPAATRLALPPAVVLTAAAAVGVWALTLHLAAGRRRLRPWLIGVLTANVLAAGAIGAAAAIRPWDALVTLLLAAVAVEVAGFAVSQAALLRRGRLA
ncbi:hypothetical protein [Actinoplanes aureus]|uniref:Uncharacterized protein n=1 Tax=Actinoplanes aureus TaxID=2792083 RepID=A0A931CDI2_9ACTN|nr:hypothetical protein [Actinoplanes aureus]MBG0565982.1 hypothetical protein [Actinoplanes aureus]